MPAADRYLRTGTEVPQIYPGTLSALTRAMKDAQRASSGSDGEHCVAMFHGSKRITIQVYEDGACTYVYRTVEG